MEDNSDLAIQLKGIDTLVSTDAFKFTDTFFLYTSGQIGPYFINSENVASRPSEYRKALELMQNKIRINTSGEYDAISGGESRDWVFSYPLAAMLGEPHLTIYNDGRTFGPEILGRNFLHIADLNNEGSSVEQKWVPTIRNNGGSINDIVFYVDRLEDGVEVMQKLNIRSHAIVPLDQIAWNVLKSNGLLSKKSYSNIMQRMENKDEWAKRMLLSDEGIRRMGEALESALSNKKGLKVLNHYSTIKQEVISRLENKFGNERVSDWMSPN